MPKADPIQQSFVSGEISPLFKGQANTDRYKTGLDSAINYLPVSTGALTRRTGTRFVAEVKDSTKKGRLLSYTLDQENAYIFELGDLNIRVYKEHAALTGPIDIVTPYTEDDIFKVQYGTTFSLNTFVHEDYVPQNLNRISDASWLGSDAIFTDGPYLPENTNGVTVTPSAVGPGAVTLTSSSPIFTSTDAPGSGNPGRFFRVRDSAGDWHAGTITAFSTTSSVTYTLVDALPDLTARGEWRFGSYSNTTGWPHAIAFHEQRQVFAGPPQTNPANIDFSQSQDPVYLAFRPTLTDGTVQDDRAFSRLFAGSEVQKIQWMRSDERGLVVGTLGGEWLVFGVDGTELTPTNTVTRNFTTYGSTGQASIRAGKNILYTSRSEKLVREILFTDSRGGFHTRDITQLAEHILRSSAGGIVEIVYQNDPFSRLWMPRKDGVLISAFYSDDTTDTLYGPTRHILGGVGNAAGDDPVVESAAVIPSPDGTRDEVWLLVKRYINGGTKRYIEYITPEFEAETDQDDGIFLDCSLTLDDPQAISGATQADPVVITTSSAHGFLDGDSVKIKDVVGTTELNDNSYIVANKTATTFELTTAAGNVDGTAFTVYVSGGKARKEVTTVTGLSHLEGETVSVVGDGLVQTDKTVASGSITIDTAASIVHVGYNYNSDAKLLRFDAGSATGTALGKTQRVTRVSMLFNRTLGVSVGGSFDKLHTMFGATETALFTGIKTVNSDINYEYGNEICIRQSTPVPGTILAVMPKLVTQDR